MASTLDDDATYSRQLDASNGNYDEWVGIATVHLIADENYNNDRSRTQSSGVNGTQTVDS